MSPSTPSGSDPSGDQEKTFVPASESSPSAAPKKKKATQLGDFKLIRKLGRGGMGEVFLANQVSLDRKVALKTLNRELAQKEDFVKRFLREARSMAKLHHPNVVQVYAVDSQKGYHFVAIEYVDGQSMQDWMKQLKRLSVGDALHVALVCAEALKHASDQQMIHRDIKPDNILVTKNGVVKVADFGLAKALDEDVSMTQSGTGMGTPLYMAPEQARNAKHVDQRSDIYALGCMLYYFVSGKLPFGGENTLELITAKEKGGFKPARQINPEVPERIDLIIDKMLAKNPEHRYADYQQLIKDLQGGGQASASLSFIESDEKAVLAQIPTQGTAATKVAGGTTKKYSGPKTSAEDARETSAENKAKTDTRWFVQFVNAKGETVVSRMTTSQVQQGLAAGTVDAKAKGKQSAEGSFLPLAQYSEFVSAVEKQAVSNRNQSRASKMQDMYSQIDKAEKKRQRWRWFRGKTEGALGLVGLLIYLAIVVAIIGGLYLLGMFAWEQIAEGLGLAGDAADSAAD